TPNCKEKRANSWHVLRYFRKTSGCQRCNSARPSYPLSSCSHEENRFVFSRRFTLPCRAVGSFLANRRSERVVSQGLHDRPAGREARAREPIQGRSRQVPVCRKPSGGAAGKAWRLAADDRRLS